MNDTDNPAIEEEEAARDLPFSTFSLLGMLIDSSKDRIKSWFFSDENATALLILLAISDKLPEKVGLSAAEM